MTPGPYKVLGPFHHGAFDSRYEVTTLDDMVIVAQCVFPRGDEEARLASLSNANGIAAIPRMCEMLGHTRERSYNANIAHAEECERWAKMFAQVCGDED